MLICWSSHRNKLQWNQNQHIDIFFKKIHSKVLSTHCRQFCSGFRCAIKYSTIHGHPDDIEVNIVWIIWYVFWNIFSFKIAVDHCWKMWLDVWGFKDVWHIEYLCYTHISFGPAWKHSLQYCRFMEYTGHYWPICKDHRWIAFIIGQ